MNCQEFWKTPPQKGAEASPLQAAHLSKCPVCAAHWEQQLTLAARLGSMREDWRQVEAPERVEAGLTAAFRANSGLRSRPAAGNSWWVPVMAWSGAAAAMFVLAVALLHGSHPAPARPDTIAAPHRGIRTAPEVASAQEGEDDDASVLGDGFVRLPNAPRIEPNEPVDFVQLSFPRSEMIALGLSVSEDRASETVLADVALGSDGTARAVRLVSDGGTY